MTDGLKQDTRGAALTTPLGDNKLSLVRLDANEGLSELFEFRVEAVSTDDVIAFDDLLGRSCSIKMKLYDEGPDRYFTGIAVEAQTLGGRNDLYVYQLLLRPSLWLLSKSHNCRIWHEKTALDIIKEVLSERRVDFRAATHRTFPKLEYCVQYRETDLDFVSRLMEQHGIYYFFEHQSGKHTMVLADSKSSHKPIPDRKTLDFAETTVATRYPDENVQQWSSQRRFRTGKFELKDYNFKQPSANMVGDHSGQERYEKSQLECYDYPGKYDTKKDGESYAEVRLDAEQALDHRRYARGEAPSLFPGGLTTLQKHPTQPENQQYLVVRARHSYAAQLYRSGNTDRERPYNGSYELLPHDRVFRAPILTPKPVVYGPQTARVVARPNNDSEEIDVDDDGYGRIRVRFHWDRDDKRSCWIRVAQSWAANKWGSQFIPRIGMEVVVEFLEGDPDRPLVVGAVYNGDNKHPYSVPDNKTQSGIRSDSSKGHNGYNELMFEDAKDKEKIRVHAQKDLETKILHSETRTIGEKFETPMGAPSRETTLVMGDDKLTIQSGQRDTMVAMNDKLTVGLNQNHEIGLNHTATVGLSQSTTVGLNQSTTVGLIQSTEAGTIVQVSAGMTVLLQSGGNAVMVGPGGVVVLGPLIVFGGIIPIPG
jgi:type VI secretion system secreted protein VgrG